MYGCIWRQAVQRWERHLYLSFFTEENPVMKGFAVKMKYFFDKDLPVVPDDEILLVMHKDAADIAHDILKSAKKAADDSDDAVSNLTHSKK